MPADDVSDLRDVVDAINKLCDTMKTSSYEDESESQIEEDSFADASTFSSYHTESTEKAGENVVNITEDAANSEVAEDWFKQYMKYPNEVHENVISRSEYSDYSDEVQSASQYTRSSEVQPQPINIQSAYSTRETDLVSPEEVTVAKTESYNANTERWSDTTSLISLPGQIDDLETVTSDTEPVLAQFEPVSEMYYTASSEISLLSDLEVPDKPQNEEDESNRGEKKECVMAGHVAAMRERFESLTRTNTPCPDLIRSLSPSLEVFRNVSPSPDKLA